MGKSAKTLTVRAENMLGEGWRVVGPVMYPAEGSKPKTKRHLCHPRTAYELRNPMGGVTLIMGNSGHLVKRVRDMKAIRGAVRGRRK